MNTKASKLFSLVLAILMCLGTMSVTAWAKTTTEDGNIWYGDEVSVDITAGQNGYTFMSVYTKPHHAYEMSNHMVSPDGAAHDIPQTLILVDASKDYTWSPDGVYTPGSSNYEVLFCVDAETGYDNGIYYKRLNLEDSTYYSAEEAAHIRAIVTNAYPYISLEQMKANLAADGFEGAEQLTRAEIITAVQAAIWYFANGVDYRYSRTFDVPANSQWGGIMHDFTNEMDVWWTVGKRKFSTDDTVGARINALIDYLKACEATSVERNQVIISDLTIVDSIPVQEKNGLYTVALQVALNNGGNSEQDDLTLRVYVDGILRAEQPVQLGDSIYDLTVEAAAGQTIKAVVSGTQTLPKGVYFYEAQGGRDVSQSLVGVAAGETDVYADAEVILPAEELPPVTADLTIQKTDKNGTPLNGASFDLYVQGATTEILVGNYTVDNSGLLTLEALLPGSYKLVETKAPEGYVLPAEAITFTVDENGDVTVDECAFAALDENGVLNVVNVPPCVEFKAGTASNISYMLIDKNGNVEFLHKIDLRDGDTSAPVIYKDGYITAIFIKQSTSGMLWISEEVDDETVDAVIACVKKNNKSYKGHDAVAFGEGSHDLTYGKKNKTHTVTYTFG